MLELSLFLATILQLAMFATMCFTIPVDVDMEWTPFFVLMVVFGVFSIILIILLGFIATFAA